MSVSHAASSKLSGMHGRGWSELDYAYIGPGSGTLRQRKQFGKWLCHSLISRQSIDIDQEQGHVDLEILKK